MVQVLWDLASDNYSYIHGPATAGIYIVSTTLLLWSANAYLTAVSYTLVLKFRLNCVLRAKLCNDYNFGIFILFLHEILHPCTAM
jgi:hypothetical protein